MSCAASFLEAGITLRIRAGLALQYDGAAIGEDQPVPDQQDAALAEADAIVVLAQQPGPLRDDQDSAGRAVIDVLGDLGGDLPRQVGADARDQRGGDDGARLQHIRRCRRHDAIGRDDASIDSGIEEGKLAILG